MITIEGKKYVFDLEAICDFISFSTKNDSKEKEVITSFTDDGKIDEKSVRELTAPSNIQMDNIRYDLAKMMVIQVLTYDEKNIESLDQMPFGTEMAFLTLINEGFLILVDDE